MTISKLQTLLLKKKVDAAFFYSAEFDPQIFFLTGYAGIGALIVPSKKEPFLVVPAMEEEKALRSNLDVVVWKKSMIEDLKLRLEKVNIRPRTLGVDDSVMTVSLSRRIEVLKARQESISDLMASIRVIKSKGEIEIIENACKLADQVIALTLKNWASFRTESDVAAFMDFETKKRGCVTSFPTIVASGSNAAVPHHEPLAQRLKKGLCVIDFGVRYRGYCSDISRTVCIGKPTLQMEEAYYAVKDAQEMAIRAVKPGMNCAELDGLARKSLGEMDRFFIHSLGHGIGVQVHEAPWLNRRSTDVLQSGMTIAIEPGIYKDGCGVRIEDDVLVAKTGYRVMTKSKKELMVL